MGVIDDISTNTDIKGYQLLIFAQDKPILENQHPKRLPLDARAETPIRADRSASPTAGGCRTSASPTA